MVKRPRRKPERPKLTNTQRRKLAGGASYAGSGEHKDQRWWGGQPKGRQLPGGRVGRRGRQTTTICPLTSDADRGRATKWVQRAIREGKYKFVEADKTYPKKIWIEVDEQIWFGFCINSESGEYKGWPIDEEERREIFG